MRKSLLVLTLLTGAAVPAMAQEGRDAFCWRGAPADRCGTFALTELAGAISTNQASRRPPWNVTWEVGAMHNVASRLAVGGTAFLTRDDQQRLLFGLKPRVRYWMTRQLGLDLAPGFVLANVQRDFYAATLPAFSGHVAVVWKDWAGLMVQLENLKPDPTPSFDQPVTTLYVGLRLGSWAGVGAGVAAAALSIVADALPDD